MLIAILFISISNDLTYDSMMVVLFMGLILCPFPGIIAFIACKYIYPKKVHIHTLNGTYSYKLLSYDDICHIWKFIKSNKFN
jgi:hypothetical protein